MPTEPTHGDITAGDVSGTFVVGDNNNVTQTTHHTEPLPPQPEPEPEPRQQSSAQDQAAVFAQQHGTMHVTYHAAAEREPGPEA
ncbi:hypothetical protein [Streptomyces sp. NPDC002790]|uniref:hypothetical protein n=1 Tax=Streptomyces sp. NPDC002790 TaxID=3154431 RepID=UPI0033285E07